MNDILTKVQNNQINYKKAYKKIYARKQKKAHFIFLRIRIKEHPIVSFLLAILFILPVPLFIIKFFGNIAAKRQFDQDDLNQIDIKELIRAISVRGTSLTVHTKKAKVKIKTF